MSRKTLCVLGILAVAVGLGMAPAARAAAAFTMDIVATGDLDADYLTFGMSALALDGYDRLGTPPDEGAPPSAPSGNDIYFYANGAPRNALAVDIRPIEDSKVWELHVVLVPGQSTTLTWGALPAAIETSELWLKNKQTGAVVKNMNTEKSVTVTDSITYVIVLGPPNTVPLAYDDEIFMLLSDTPRTIDVLFNDKETDAGQTLSVTAITPTPLPAGQGTAAISSNQIIYTPGTFVGVLTFTYTITDTGTSPATATATVTVHVSDNIVGKRTPEGKAKPGKPYVMDYEIRYNPASPPVSLKLTEVIPFLEGEPPAGWWNCDLASFVMTSAGTVPTVTKDNEKLVFDFGSAVPTSPITFKITFTVPADAVNDRRFLGDIEYQLVVAGPVLAETMPETVVAIARANLDVDNSHAGAFYNAADLRLLFNYQFAGGKTDNAKLCAGTVHLPNAATKGPEIRANIDGMISDLDIDSSHAGAFYNAADLRILFNYQFAGGKTDNVKVCAGTVHAPNAATKGPEFRAKIDGMIGN